MEPTTTAALIGGGGQVAGSLLSSAWSAHSAKKNREFQERMSSTAHQREVKDLKAAGLNPILSAMGGSGAQAMSGSLPTIQNPGQGLADLGVKGVEAKTRKQQASTALELAQSNIEKNKSSANLDDATTARQLAEIENVNQTLNNLKKQGRLTQEQINQLHAENQKRRLHGRVYEGLNTALDFITDPEKFGPKGAGSGKDATRNPKRYR